MKKCLLIVCILVGCTFKIFGQFTKKDELSFVDCVPLVISSKLYIDSLAPENTMMVIADRIRIEAVQLESAFGRKRVITVRDSLVRINLDSIEYQYRFNMDAPSNWNPLKKGLTARIILDTAIRVGQTVTLCFRNKFDHRILQETNFTRCTLTPSLKAFHLQILADTSNVDYPSFKLLKSATLWPGFSELVTRDLKIEPGNRVFLQLQKKNESLDSCIYYRLRNNNGIVLQDWKRTGHFLGLNELNADNQYLIDLKYTGSERIATFSIDALPYWYQKLWIELVIEGVIALLVFLVYRIWHYYRKRNRNRELQLIEEQLKNNQNLFNPHFLFNCFANIEAYYADNQVEQANQLMGEMTGLIRDVLKRAGTMMAKLSDEIAILEKFVRVEQLRFPFRIQYFFDNELDLEIIPFPPMLLQPSVENAIRHGVSGMGSEGLVTIWFQKQGDTLIIMIEDNGTSAKPQPWDTKGHSIYFTKTCIEKLQKVYPKTKLYYECVNTDSGTKVRFVFENWMDNK